MYLKTLLLENYRNYEQLNITLPENGAVFFGANGSGKTNILEAVHLLCTGKSQKNARRNEIVRHQSEYARLGGDFFSESKGVHLKCTYLFNRENESDLRINEQRQSSFSFWYGTQPIVSFSPEDVELVLGSPDNRRRFVDMLISQVDKEYLRALILYRKNLFQRNALLKSGDDTVLFSVYEQGMAENGEIIVIKRSAVAEDLRGYGASIYTKLSSGKELFSLEYHPAVLPEKGGLKLWKNVFYTMLSDRRKKDRELGFSSFGPHRDDLHLLLDQKSAKAYSSQGQSRTIALSLKLASMLIIEKMTGRKPIVLFDDAASELDPERTSKVYGHLQNRGQIFVASPHDTVAATNGVRWFRVAENTAIAYDR
jgi:DNA replication and repair protein RecF